MPPTMMVDSSVWIDYLNGVQSWRTDRLHDALAEQEVCLCDVVLQEVLQGIRDDTLFHEVRRLLTGLLLVNTGGKEKALRAASHYRTLRKRGSPVRSTIDCVIASTAIELGIPLLGTDRDFEPFALLGLALLAPQQESP